MQTSTSRAAKRPTTSQLRKKIAAIAAGPTRKAAGTLEIAGVSLPPNSRLQDPFHVPRDIASAGVEAFARFEDVAARRGIEPTETNRFAYAYAEMRRVALARSGPPDHDAVDRALWVDSL